MHSSRSGLVPRCRLAGWNLRRLRQVRFQADPIIHRVAEALFAAQVPLRRLHRDVSQQELNLLQFTTGLMTKTGTRPTEVVRCERRNPTVLCFLFHDTPNNFGAESGAPNPASFVDRTKECTRCNPCGRHPSVNSGFHPIRDWNGSYMAALAGKKNLGNDVWNEPLLKLDRGANSAE